MKDAIEADAAFQNASGGEANAMRQFRTNIQARKHEGCFLFMPAYAEEMDTGFA